MCLRYISTSKHLFTQLCENLRNKIIVQLIYQSTLNLEINWIFFQEPFKNKTMAEDSDFPREELAEE